MASDAINVLIHLNVLFSIRQKQDFSHSVIPFPPTFAEIARSNHVIRNIFIHNMPGTVNTAVSNGAFGQRVLVATS